MPCEGLIADHVRSNVEPAEAAAWLVDGFGVAHPVADKTTIGRNHDGELVLLASSVSREHAELKATSAGWSVRDLGSRNGTFIDGGRCLGRQTVPARARLTIGDVSMWFLAEIAHAPGEALSLATATAGGGLVRHVLMHGELELCVVGTHDPASGGSLLVRRAGGDGWTERGLAPLEFQLLRALCVRAHEQAGAPSSVKGCVATKQLARDLPFQSKYANEENVRQVVRRLRGLLSDLGADGLVAVSPGRGYYLVCTSISSERGG